MQRRERRDSATASAKKRWEKTNENQSTDDTSALPSQCYPESESESESKKKEAASAQLRFAPPLNEKSKPSIHLREKILEALGADPISGVTATGKCIGTQADMAMVAGWLTLPGITEAAILTEVQQAMATQTGRGRRPQSIAYFAGRIADLSAALTAPPPTPQPPGAYNIRAMPPPLRVRIDPDDYDDNGKRIRPWKT